MFVGAGVILRNAVGQILLVCDARSGRWGFPKGHPERCDERDPLKTATRECWEETGLKYGEDYILDTVKPKRIGKRLYYGGICNATHFRSIPHEISDVRWWSSHEFVGMDDYMNADLRSWVKKQRLGSPSFGPIPAPAMH
jgi:8-oxo-dGTP pyrophosphatase MutT (NUDIX family)